MSEAQNDPPPARPRRSARPRRADAYRPGPTLVENCNSCRRAHHSCDVDVANSHGCSRCRTYGRTCRFGDRVLPARPADVPTRARVPRSRTTTVCDQCRRAYNQTCDVDPEAGIGCRVCVAKKPETLTCTFEGREMTPRPPLGDPILDSIRHACDMCYGRRLKTCSWLDNVAARSEPCGNCHSYNRTCLRNREPPNVAATQVPHATPAVAPLFRPRHRTPPDESRRRSQSPPAPAADVSMEGMDPALLEGMDPALLEGMDPALLKNMDPAFLENLDLALANPNEDWMMPAVAFGGDAPQEPAVNNMDFDWDVPGDQGQAQMGLGVEPDAPIHDWAAQAPASDLARKVHAFMQRRAEKLMAPDRYVNPELLAVGDPTGDPRLGHDPFAPPGPAANEDLQRQFPPDVVWTATRFGSFKLRAMISPPFGKSDVPFSPGPYISLFKGAYPPVREENADPAGQPATHPSDIAALASIPTISAATMTMGGEYRADLVGQTCEEHVALAGNAWAVCGRAVAPPVTHCVDRNHASTEAAVVCAECNDKSKSLLLAADVEQLRTDEILAARAYACAGCLGRGAAQRESFWFSGHRVWGYAEEEDQLTAAVGANEGGVRGGFMGKPTPVWGCGCAKLLTTLCQEHRMMLAEAWLTQVDLMNEWIVSMFGQKVCPVCNSHTQLGINAFGFAGDVGGNGAEKHMWACLSCQEFVVVPRQEGEGLIPGIEELVVDVNSYFKKSSELYRTAGAGKAVAAF